MDLDNLKYFSQIFEFTDDIPVTDLLKIMVLDAGNYNMTVESPYEYVEIIYKYGLTKYFTKYLDYVMHSPSFTWLVRFEILVLLSKTGDDKYTITTSQLSELELYKLGTYLHLFGNESELIIKITSEQHFTLINTGNNDRNVRSWVEFTYKPTKIFLYTRKVIITNINYDYLSNYQYEAVKFRNINYNRYNMKRLQLLSPNNEFEDYYGNFDELLKDRVVKLATGIESTIPLSLFEYPKLKAYSGPINKAYDFNYFEEMSIQNKSNLVASRVGLLYMSIDEDTDFLFSKLYNTYINELILNRLPKTPLYFKIDAALVELTTIDIPARLFVQTFNLNILTSLSIETDNLPLILDNTPNLRSLTTYTITTPLTHKKLESLTVNKLAVALDTPNLKWLNVSESIEPIKYDTVEFLTLEDFDNATIDLTFFPKLTSLKLIDSAVSILGDAMVIDTITINRSKFNYITAITFLKVFISLDSINDTIWYLLDMLTPETVLKFLDMD